VFGGESVGLCEVIDFKGLKVQYLTSAPQLDCQQAGYDIISLMCGAYGFSVKDAREVYDRFGVMNKLLDFKPHWRIGIGSMNPVIYMTADGA